LPPDSPPASNYTTTVDTVLDLTTGLEWQREIAAQPQVEGVSAAGVCQGVTAGGNKDWRLPSRMELLTLLYYESFDPTINATAFPNDPPAEGEVWTLTPSSLVPGALRTVDFQSTALDTIATTGFPEQVRCVRVAQVKSNGAAPHYTVVVSGPNGLVHDNWTGLSWAVYAPDSPNFASVMAYCGALQIGTLTSGFRAPSMKELWSLWDETASSGPLWNQAMFGMGPGGMPPRSLTAFWSSTTNFGDTTEHWGLDFWAAATPATPVADGDPGGGYRIRCVHD
jgi:hypothetical protein